MSVTYESHAARALVPPGGPLMLVTERATMECGCMVFAGTVAGKGDPSVVPWPCAAHVEVMPTFAGHLTEVLSASAPPPSPELVRIAGGLLEATLREAG